MKDFLSLADLSRENMRELLDFTRVLMDRHERGESLNALSGKTLVMFFEKASTRTRVSFEVGMTQLGGHAVFMNRGDSQIGRGEEIKDTARVLSEYADCILVRTFAHDIAEELAKWAKIPVINGLTDKLHPCQALADTFTMETKLGGPEELKKSKVAYVGDGNNMANSLINAAALIGFALSIATPEGHEPDSGTIENAKKLNDKISISHDPREAVDRAHVVHTDVWASMGQEDEAEARSEVFKPYQVNTKLLGGARSDAFVMHCLPAHKGEEISEEVFDANSEVIIEQARNRLHAQKALLIYLMAPEVMKSL